MHLCTWSKWDPNIMQTVWTNDHTNRHEAQTHQSGSGSGHRQMCANDCKRIFSYLFIRSKPDIQCCRICENVSHFNTIREIIQNACYFVFSTVLSKIFYINMFTYSPQDNFFSNNLVHKCVTPWFLTLCGHLNDPQLCVYSVMVVHESLVWSEQLNGACSSDKSSSSCTLFSFSASSAYLNPFQQ